MTKPLNHQIDDRRAREPIKIKLDEVDAFDSVWVKLLKVTAAATAIGRTEGARLVSQIGPNGEREWVGEVLPERTKA